MVATRSGRRTSPDKKVDNKEVESAPSPVQPIPEEVNGGSSPEQDPVENPANHPFGVVTPIKVIPSPSPVKKPVEEEDAASEPDTTDYQPPATGGKAIAEEASRYPLPSSSAEPSQDGRPASHPAAPDGGTASPLCTPVSKPSRPLKPAAAPASTTTRRWAVLLVILALLGGVAAALLQGCYTGAAVSIAPTTWQPTIQGSVCKPVNTARTAGLQRLAQLQQATPQRLSSAKQSTQRGITWLLSPVFHVCNKVVAYVPVGMQDIQHYFRNLAARVLPIIRPNPSVPPTQPAFASVLSSAALRSIVLASSDEPELEDIYSHAAQQQQQKRKGLGLLLAGPSPEACSKTVHAVVAAAAAAPQAVQVINGKDYATASSAGSLQEQLTAHLTSAQHGGVVVVHDLHSMSVPALSVLNTVLSEGGAVQDSGRSIPTHNSLYIVVAQSTVRHSSTGFANHVKEELHAQIMAAAPEGSDDAGTDAETVVKALRRRFDFVLPTAAQDALPPAPQQQDQEEKQQQQGGPAEAAQQQQQVLAAEAEVVTAEVVYAATAAGTM